MNAQSNPAALSASSCKSAAGVTSCSAVNVCTAKPCCRKMRMAAAIKCEHAGIYTFMVYAVDKDGNAAVAKWRVNVK